MDFKLSSKTILNFLENWLTSNKTYLNYFYYFRLISTPTNLNFEEFFKQFLSYTKQMLSHIYNHLKNQGYSTIVIDEKSYPFTYEIFLSVFLNKAYLEYLADFIAHYLNYDTSQSENIKKNLKQVIETISLD